MCEIATHHDIHVSSSLVKRNLKAVILNALMEKGIFTSQDGSVTGAIAAMSSSEGCFGMAEPSGSISRSDSQLEVTESQHVDLTPGMACSEKEKKLFTLPQFNHLLVESLIWL